MAPQESTPKSRTLHAPSRALHHICASPDVGRLVPAASFGCELEASSGLRVVATNGRL